MATEEPRVDAEDEEAEGEQADGTLDPDLLAACMRNDTEAAKKLIEQGANPCCEDQRQWSPLIWAASHGNEDLTRLLIKHNAAEVYKYDENTKVRKKHSPLHWAAFKGHLKVTPCLLPMSAFVDHYEVLGCDPAASPAELKRAYHEKLREYHPDKRPESRGDTGARVTQAVLDAWSILQAYDALWHKKRNDSMAAEARRREGNELYKEAQALGKKSGPESLSAATSSLTRYQAAIDKYSEGIDLAPMDHRIRSNRALCYSALKDWQRCKEDAAIVVEMKPDFMKGWFLLVKAFWKEGNPIAAQRHLDSALQILPGSSELLALQEELAPDVQAASNGDLLPPVGRGRASRNVSPSCTPAEMLGRILRDLVKKRMKGLRSLAARTCTAIQPQVLRLPQHRHLGETARHRRHQLRSARKGPPLHPWQPPVDLECNESECFESENTASTMLLLQVLWLLMAPPQNLSHHERDAIGNTPLHQAAAGGNLECAKCLMAQGCDVLAKNDRGHTPFALCTDPEVQQLLQNAMNATACKASGKQFSSTVLRYLCSWSLDVFCEKEITQTFVYEHPEASEKEKPVTWCNEVRATIQDLEHQLNHAMHLNQLDTVTAALEAAADKPVDCKLVHQCNQLKEKLESEIQLGKAMQVTTITNLDEFDGVHDALSKAIDDAVAKKADPGRVQAAKTLRRKLLAEASLMRTVLGPQKTTVAHISMLQELLSAAKNENANEDLIVQASKLIARLSSESEVQKRITATAVLCEVDSFKEAEGREEMPDWSQNTEKFEDFHEDFKKVMEDAERDQISEVLMGTALEQLDKIERLLVEKKQTEAEMGLKARYLRCQWQVASGNLLPGCKSCQEEREEVMKLAKCHPSVSHSEGTNVLVHAVSNNGGAGWQMECRRQMTRLFNVLTIGRLCRIQLRKQSWRTLTILQRQL
eukprot:symbB.v1.2.014745.t1/scaffold1081.1/size139474/2